ncbi:MAG TPA: hypothetical protein VGD64_09485 [Acidisarcina sp.]
MIRKSPKFSAFLSIFLLAYCAVADAQRAAPSRLPAEALKMPGMTVALNFMGGGGGKSVADQSGQGNHCTLAEGKSAPSLTAAGMVLKPVPGVPQYCTLPAAASQWNWAIIAATFDYRLQVDSLPVVLGSTTDCVSAHGVAGQQCLITGWVTSGVGFGKNAAMLALERQGTLANDSIAGPTVVGAYYGSSAVDRDRVFIDGIPAHVYQAGQFYGLVQNGGEATIGNGLFNGTAHPWSGTIQAVLLGTGSPSAAEFQSASLALKAMVARQGSSAAPDDAERQIHGAVNVVCTGDSIEWGTGTTHGGPCSPYYLSSGLSEPTVGVNHAMPSYFASALQYGANKDAVLLYQRSAIRNVVFIQTASNDMYQGGRRGAGQTIFDENCAASRQYREAGFMTALVSGLSRGNPRVDAIKNAYDLYAASNWATCFDDFVDEAADVRLGADGASYANGAGVKGTYFGGDNTHLTDAGADLVAIYRKSHLNAYSNASTEKNPRVIRALTYTMNPWDFFVKVIGPASVTLPAAESWTGHRYVITNASAAAIVVKPGASLATGALQPVDGSTSDVAVPAGGRLELLVYVPTYAAGGPAWMRVR